MANYKNTLNLPFSSFPMRANLPQREPQMLRRWEEIDLYQTVRSARTDCPKFILHDGPPYANGDIHMGHVVNKVLKDIILKHKLMQGYDTPFVPGWDCHGLPIEHQIEKKFGKAGGKLSASEFRQHCRRHAERQVERQRADFIRLGVLGDWQRPYLSMHPHTEADILRAFARMVALKHVQRGIKPVHWCLQCASALAEAEVERLPKTSNAATVCFPAIDSESWGKHLGVAFGGRTVSVIIWTTTPWTLPANQAVAVHKDFDYTIAESGGKIYMFASELSAAVQDLAGWDKVSVIGSCKGAAMERLTVQHCWQDRAVPIVLSGHVTLDAGSGCVHIAPCHGLDDFYVGQNYRLANETPVGLDGKFHADAGVLAGLDVFASDAKIASLIDERGNLLSMRDYQHSYPHCWRHRTPIISLSTPQWFIKLANAKLLQDSLHSCQQVRWVPAWGQERMEGMLRDRPDWCISRQRSWGVPLSLVVHKKTGQLHPDTEQIFEKASALITKHGVEIWHKLAVSDLIDSADVADYRKVDDILDVWFDSGVTHASVLDQHDDLHTPADLYLEGSDQHRGWFSASLITAVALRQSPPFKQVLTHSFVVDEHGMKMSKSRGNVVDLKQVLKNFGADILRLWVCASDFKTEMIISPQILARVSDAYRRMRNTGRFLLSNLNDFDPDQHLLPHNGLLSLDRWAIAETLRTQQSILQSYDDYSFHEVFKKVHYYCTNVLGAVYLDIIKDRLYTMPPTSIGRRSAQSALFHIAHALLRWIAPVLSFTAEEMYQVLPGPKHPTVFVERCYVGLADMPPDASVDCQDWQRIMDARALVLHNIEDLRKNKVLGSSLDAEVTLYCDGEIGKSLAKIERELKFVFITSTARLLPFAHKPAAAISLNEQLALYLQACPDPKCARCWNRCPTVGTNLNDPVLCQRCTLNTTSPTLGETRLHA